MCGIGGVMCRGERRPDRDGLERMIAVMKERGPDDRGLLIDGPVGLAHTRLSIIDLSPAGRCPMTNETGDVHVVFNGEIYNFVDLRDELVLCGHAFRSSSDTEVLVHGWEEWGDDLVHRLDGMFAFAVWDGRSNELFMARDRMGEKPLFYFEGPTGFVFASSLNAISAYLPGALEMRPEAIAAYLAMSFIPGPETVYRGVLQLPPGFALRLRREGVPCLIRYWDFERAEPVRISPERARDLVLEKMEEAVRLQLVADVPVGGFLSGGIDSSLVMALASRKKLDLQAFTIGFEGADVDELPRARLLASRYGLRHHEEVVTERHVLDSLPELVWQYGQPFGDSSCIPTFFVSRLARQHVTVCLSGDGGDEAFAGYRRAAWGATAERWQAVTPGWLRGATDELLVDRLWGLSRDGMLKRAARVSRLAAEVSEVPYFNDSSWAARLGGVAGDQLKGMAGAAGARKEGVARSMGPYAGRAFQPFQRILYDDYKIQLPYDFLTKIDVASMAAGLEVRTPFLHRKVVECAWSLPQAYKIRRGVSKWLLREMAKKFVPEEVLRAPKVGFAIPGPKWWRGSLGQALFELLPDSVAADEGWIRKAVVEDALREHQSGVTDHSTRLFLVLGLEIWLRMKMGRWSRRQSLGQLLGRSQSARSVEAIGASAG